MGLGWDVTASGKKMLKKAIAWLTSLNARCPVCLYDYSKIDYSDLYKRGKIVERAWKKRAGDEPGVDWFMEHWPEENLFIKTIGLWREDKPYFASCLNCNRWLLVNPITQDLKPILVENEGYRTGGWQE